MKLKVVVALLLVLAAATAVGTQTLPAMGQTATTTPADVAQYAIPGGTIVWSADYETGSQSQFISNPNTGGEIANECNGTVAVSSVNPPTYGAIVHSGNYAGYYSGTITTPDAADTCHVDDVVWNIAGYNTNSIDLYSNFYEEGWIYVPSQSLSTCESGCWISFFGFSGESVTTFAFNSSPPSSTNIVAYSVELGKTFTQNVGAPVQWPLNQWFQLAVLVHNLGTAQASFILYLNGVEIMNYSGYMITPDPLYATHWGAYFSGGQGSETIYNDDILFESLPSSTTATTPTSITATTSSTTTTRITVTTIWTTTASLPRRHHR